MLILILVITIIASITYYHHAKNKDYSSGDLDILSVVLILINFVVIVLYVYY